MSTNRHVHTILRERATQWVIPPMTYPIGYDLAYVGGGNSITPSGYIGIKKIATELSSISAYVPSSFPSTVDGIGWGWHYRLGAWVLLLNDSRSGPAHDLPVNTPCFISFAPINISSQTCFNIVLV